MAQSSNPISGKTIPFDGERAYVVRHLPLSQEKHSTVDSLGRTEGERKFLDSFVAIFKAASKGDLKEVQRIVDEDEFDDADAYSIGKFADLKSNKRFDNKSPRQMAEDNGHEEITAYFLSRFGNAPQRSLLQTRSSRPLS